MRLLLVLIMAIACTRGARNPLGERDIFEKVFYLKRNQTIEDVQLIFGKPRTITQHESEPHIDNYYFEKNDENPSVNVFFNRDSKKILSFAITFWGDFDGYEYLKERFKGYKWIETPIPSKLIDVVEEVRKVEIPEVGVTFEYDNQDPLRRPMWIFVK